MAPEIFTAVTQISGVLGLLGLITYLVYTIRVREIASSERSVRQVVEGEGLFNSDQILQILREFKDDKARLEALKTLARLSDSTAQRVYRKIKGNVDLQSLDDKQAKRRQRLSLWATLFFLAVGLLGLAYTFSERSLGRHESSSPSPTPSPSASTSPLSRQDIQSHWKPIIFQVSHSKLVESYMPDELHAPDLVNAIRDNKNLQEMLKDFEGKVPDNVISGRWFTGINNALQKIQDDLTFVDLGVAQSPRLLRIYPEQQSRLQTAEYSRAELLGLLTQVSLQLGMDDPRFPNTIAKAVPTDTPTQTAVPTPIHTKLLIFGDHFDQSKVYIVTGAPDYDLGPPDDGNQKYISRSCKGPNQVLPIPWSQLLDKPTFFAQVPPPPSLPLPYKSGPYTIKGMRIAVYDSHIAIPPSTEGLPEVSQAVANKYDDERWWIFDVDVQP